jgi:hypothetical protein
MTSCKADPALNDATACEKTYFICPSSPRASSEDVSACARTLDAPCGTIMRQYLACATGNCDDAGVLDEGAVQSKCGLILEAYRKCGSTDASAARPSAPAGDASFATGP